MTRDELLIEVAQDVKWLKSNTECNALANSGEHKQIIEHLTMLNGKTAKNTAQGIVNRYGVIICLAINSIIITILLHLMGVY